MRDKTIHTEAAVGDKPLTQAVTAFDYSGLPPEVADRLRGITECVTELQHTYAWGMAYQVGRAHDLLCGEGGACKTVLQAPPQSDQSDEGGSCKTVLQLHKANGNRGEATFTAWCEYIGLNRQTAYNLLNAYRLICQASPEQQEALQKAPARLLYAAGKKDAPPELVDGVKAGDITTHKQYQELLARYEQAHAAAHKYHTQAEEAEAMRSALLDEQGQTVAELAETKKQLEGARQVAEAARLRADKWRDKAETLAAQAAPPVEAAVIDRDEVERLAEARAQELLAQVAPAPAEDAEEEARHAYDAMILAARSVDNAYKLARPWLGRLAPTQKTAAIDLLLKKVEEIREELQKWR